MQKFPQQASKQSDNLHSQIVCWHPFPIPLGNSPCGVWRPKPAKITHSLFQKDSGVPYRGRGEEQHLTDLTDHLLTWDVTAFQTLSLTFWYLPHRSNLTTSVEGYLGLKSVIEKFPIKNVTAPFKQHSQQQTKRLSAFCDDFRWPMSLKRVGKELYVYPQQVMACCDTNASNKFSPVLKDLVWPRRRLRITDSLPGTLGCSGGVDKALRFSS